MKKITITKAANLSTASDLQGFEAQKGIQLPESFKQFLLTHNLYIIEENKFLFSKIN
ncbi:MAG: SMI1/KNR4 family protein [Bacteroidota bacterium]